MKSFLLFDQLLCMLDDVCDADAELFEGDCAGCAGAEAVDADDRAVVADILIPAHGGTGFDGDFGRVLGEESVLVGLVLLVEDAEAPVTLAVKTCAAPAAMVTTLGEIAIVIAVAPPVAVPVEPPLAPTAPPVDVPVEPPLALTAPPEDIPAAKTLVLSACLLVIK